MEGWRHAIQNWKLFFALPQIDQMSVPPQLEVQEIGDATVVRFRDPRITNPLEIEELGRQLYHVLEVNNCGKLVIDFSSVEFLSSATIGKLISLNRKVRACRAALRLCGLRPQIQEIFRLCNLDRVFDVRDDRTAALASF